MNSTEIIYDKFNSTECFFPDWLSYPFHLSMALGFCIFLIVVLVLSFFNKFRMKGTQFSSKHLISSLIYYSIFRIFFFIATNFENHIYYLSLVSTYFGSTMFYISFMIFHLYWFKLFILTI
jgi:hypothetical protein